MTFKPKEPFVLHATDEPYLKKIPERMTQPLCLAHKGKGYKNIAAALDIPLGSVKSRIHRARAHILKKRAEAEQQQKVT